MATQARVLPGSPELPYAAWGIPGSPELRYARTQLVGYAEDPCGCIVADAVYPWSSPFYPELDAKRRTAFQGWANDFLPGSGSLEGASELLILAVARKWAQHCQVLEHERLSIERRSVRTKKEVGRWGNQIQHLPVVVLISLKESLEQIGSHLIIPVRCH